MSVSRLAMTLSEPEAEPDLRRCPTDSTEHIVKSKSIFVDDKYFSPFFGVDKFVSFLLIDKNLSIDIDLKTCQLRELIFFLSSVVSVKLRK